MAAVQAIAGVTPPERAEARMRETWPSVAAVPAVAGIGRALTNTIVLAPVAWLLMSVIFFGKVAPFFMRRYTLTNRRLMIRLGWTGRVAREVPLADIDDVRIVRDGNSDFFRSATLDVISGGKTVLSLCGVREPEGFRHAILTARNAWVPGKAGTLPFIPASATN